MRFLKRFLKNVLIFSISVGIVLLVENLIYIQFKRTAIYQIPFISPLTFIGIIIICVITECIILRFSEVYRKQQIRDILKSLLKHFSVLGITIFLLFRNFTVLTPDKIYHSSIGTLFLTKEYNYSQVNKITFSERSSKSAINLKYEITFDGHTVDLYYGMPTAGKSKNRAMRVMYSNIKETSKNVEVINNLKTTKNMIYQEAEYITRGDIDNYQK